MTRLPQLSKEDQKLLHEWVTDQFESANVIAKSFSEFRGLYTPYFEVSSLDAESLRILLRMCPEFTLGAEVRRSGFHHEHYDATIEVRLNGFDVRAKLAEIKGESRSEEERFFEVRDPGPCVVLLEDGVWLASGLGDPARTLKRENALVYPSKKDGIEAILAAREFRPFREARTEPSPGVSATPL